MKYVVLYAFDPARTTEAQAHFPAHRARLDAFHAAGDLLLVGPFVDPRDGAMGVFRTREAADAFVAGDPFVVHGVVANVTVRGWQEFFGG